MTHGSAWQPLYDMAAWLSRPGDPALPLPAFRPRQRPGDRRERVRDGVTPRIDSLVRTSASAPPVPYLVPGSSYDQLWTWDAYFTGLAVQATHPEAFAGSLDLLLDAVRDGRPATRIDADGVAEYTHAAQPLHAQWALQLVRAGIRDVEWLRGRWPVLAELRQWWDQTCRSRRGLYRWIDGSGTGIDNDRATYARPGGEVALVDVNCFQLRELSAMASIAELVGMAGDTAGQQFRDSHDELSEAIADYMWDETDACYYHLHLTSHSWRTLQEPTWELPYKMQSWGCLFPLWTGAAPARQADRLIRRHVLDPDGFLSPFGIRSTPRSDRMYNNLSMADPSNWQGPVWGLSTALTCYGLARYSYRAEAIRIATRWINLLADDLDANGTIHEFYDAETGAPGFHPDFLCWNLLALRLLDDLENGVDPTELD